MILVRPALAALSAAALLALVPAGAGARTPGPATAQDAPADFDPALIDRWFPLAHPDSWALLVEVRINGRAALALIDSATPTTIIDAGFVRDQRLPVRTLYAAEKEGEESIEGATLRTLTFGAARIFSADIPMTDLSGAIKAVGYPVALVIGTDMLRNLALEFDFDGKRMRVQPSGTPPPEGIELPLAIDSNTGIPLVTVDLAATRIGGIVVASSGGEGLTISSAIWRQLPLDGARVTDVRVGDGEDMIRPFTRVPALLGPIDLGRLEVLANDSQSVIANLGANGVLATGTLRPRYNLFLDPGGGVMVLGPRSKPEEVRQPGKIGIQGDTSDDGFKIVHVMRNSPGEAAGLRAGDAVCIVNGERVRASWVGTPKDDWGKAPDGTKVSLGLCDGRSVVVTLSEFY
ncbi:PDZ domain-containing protein [Sphingomonas canadensis]|uniref:PDZ domain-containing protein n=1 Tax=Sphingomonas canadensis TaxID=1219257 RepID=A0ABW3H8B0_9SPHN|nr:PDZ domain-containing protein [Sphingomonas canadensis]MCW3836539.1 PDZ domain-containing protein [Sphingomonas canadensis]